MTPSQSAVNTLKKVTLPVAAASTIAAGPAGLPLAAGVSLVAAVTSAGKTKIVNIMDARRAAKMDKISRQNAIRTVLAQNNLLYEQSPDGGLPKNKVEYYIEDENGRRRPVKMSTELGTFSISESINAIGDKITGSLGNAAKGLSKTVKANPSMATLAGSAVNMARTTKVGSALYDVVGTSPNRSKGFSEETCRLMGDHLANILCPLMPNSEKSYGVNEVEDTTDVSPAVASFIEDYNSLSVRDDKVINLFWERAKSSLSIEDFDALIKKLEVH